MKKQNKVKAMAWACFVVAIFAITAAFFVGRLSGRQESVTTINNSITTEGIYCNAANLDGAFFNSSKAKNEKYTVSYTFSEQKVNKVFLTYAATFATEDEAVNELSNLQAKYNKFMGGTQIYMSALSPNFTNRDNEISISLYFEQKTFTPEISELVFLDTNELAKVRGGERDEVRRIYEAKTFTCKNSN